MERPCPQESSVYWHLGLREGMPCRGRCCLEPLEPMVSIPGIPGARLPPSLSPGPASPYISSISFPLDHAPFPWPPLLTNPPQLTPLFSGPAPPLLIHPTPFPATSGPRPSSSPLLRPTPPHPVSHQCFSSFNPTPTLRPSSRVGPCGRRKHPAAFWSRAPSCGLPPPRRRPPCLGFGSEGSWLPRSGRLPPARLGSAAGEGPRKHSKAGQHSAFRIFIASVGRAHPAGTRRS